MAGPVFILDVRHIILTDVILLYESIKILCHVLCTRCRTDVYEAYMWSVAAVRRQS